MEDKDKACQLKEKRILQQTIEKYELHKKRIRENVRKMFGKVFMEYLSERESKSQSEREKESESQSESESESESESGADVASALEINQEARALAINLEKHIFNYTISRSALHCIRHIVWSNQLVRRIYAERSRDLYCNLNPKGYVGNTTLIHRLLVAKEFDLKTLVYTMTSSRDLMPERYIAYDEEIRRERELIENYVEEIPDGAFKCGRCKSMKTKHSILQVRSADESGTAYIVCMNCGNRWKQAA